MIPLNLFVRKNDEFGEPPDIYRTDMPGWYTDDARAALLGEADEAIYFTSVKTRPLSKVFDKYTSATNIVTEDVSLRIEPVEGEIAEGVTCPECLGSGTGACPNCDCKCECECECRRCYGETTITEVIKQPVQGRIVMVGGNVRAAFNPAFGPMLSACDELRCDGPDGPVVGFIGGKPVAIAMPIYDREIR